MYLAYSVFYFTLRGFFALCKWQPLASYPHAHKYTPRGSAVASVWSITASHHDPRRKPQSPNDALSMNSEEPAEPLSCVFAFTVCSCNTHQRRQARQTKIDFTGITGLCTTAQWNSGGVVARAFFFSQERAFFFFFVSQNCNLHLHIS